MNDPLMQNSSSPDSRESVPSLSSNEQGAKKNETVSFLRYAAIALGLALVIRFFIAAPYVVQGASMEPTFDNWDYLIIDKVSYRLGEPQRGDVIVFDLPQNLSRSLIKRVIGLPGDTVSLSGNTVTIANAAHPKGFSISEPYLDSHNLGGATDIKMTLGPDQFFVLGDNRKVSADSRLWGILPRQDIVGRVYVRLYPFSKIGILPGEARYSN